MFIGADQNPDLDAAAADPVLRRAAIAVLSTRRKRAFWPLPVLWGIALFADLPRYGDKMILLWTMALVSSACYYFKLQSDLRLLQAIDRLDKKYQSEPSAPPSLPTIRPIQRPERKIPSNSPAPRPDFPSPTSPLTKIRPIPRPTPNNQ